MARDSAVAFQFVVVSGMARGVRGAGVNRLDGADVRFGMPRSATATGHLPASTGPAR